MPAASRAALSRGLDAGLAELGLPLSPAVRVRLLDYLALLGKWNAVYNLTAVRDPQAMLVQHLLDSLAVVAPLAQRSERRCIVDVGSGGGLPGIVLAIVWPQAAVHLVDPVGKKAAFLRQCAAELALTRITVHAQRVEQLAPDPGFAPDLIICRAFASLADYVLGIEALVGPDTRVAAMKGRLPHDEIAALAPRWTVSEALTVTVPGLDAQRHLLMLAPAAAAAVVDTDAVVVPASSACSR